MLNKVMITGETSPNTEINFFLQLDNLLREIENPALLYYGKDGNTADLLRIYGRLNKIPFAHYEENKQKTYSAMVGNDYVIFINPNRQAIQANRERGKYNFLRERTALIYPKQDAPRQKDHNLPPPRKAKRSRRRQR